MATLQSQGVPIKAGLSGPQYTGRHRANVSETGSPQAPRAARKNRGAPRTRQASRSAPSRDVREYSPTRVADKATSGVGLLEAEFIGSLVLLVMLMFASTSIQYSDKIMSIMKRGTLVCLYFFILALVAAIGPNMAKVAKALGGLCLVAILLTAPVASFDSKGNLTGGMLYDIDQLIESDWVGSSEHGTDVGSADSGSASSSNGSSPLGAASGAIQRITGILGQLGFGIIK